MSRVGKQAIKIPDKVQVAVKDGKVAVKGPLGSDEVMLDPFVTVEVGGGLVSVQRKGDAPIDRTRHGLMRKLIANSVQGVSVGFECALDIVGVGYRADVRGKELVLSLGFSHPVVFHIPEGLKVSVDKQTKITLKGVSRQLVGDTAARIRLLRPPEPYKGKGIKYAGEVIIRKAGKAAVGGGSPGGGK